MRPTESKDPWAMLRDAHKQALKVKTDALAFSELRERHARLIIEGKPKQAAKVELEMHRRRIALTNEALN